VQTAAKAPVRCSDAAVVWDSPHSIVCGFCAPYPTHLLPNALARSRAPAQQRAAHTALQARHLLCCDDGHLAPPLKWPAAAITAGADAAPERGTRARPARYRGVSDRPPAPWACASGCPAASRPAERAPCCTLRPRSRCCTMVGVWHGRVSSCAVRCEHVRSAHPRTQPTCCAAPLATHTHTRTRTHAAPCRPGRRGTLHHGHRPPRGRGAPLHPAPHRRQPHVVRACVRVRARVRACVCLAHSCCLARVRCAPGPWAGWNDGCRCARVCSCWRPKAWLGCKSQQPRRRAAHA
jgi:hypothetical protein